MATATTQPWSPTVKPLTQGINDLSSLYRSGGLRRTYGPRRTAGLNSTLSSAWDATAQRAQAGNPLLDKSQDYYSDLLSGKYLTRDAPGFDSVIGAATDAVNANKFTAGRLGSGAHSAALAREIGGLEYQNYARERGLMDNAAAMAPEIAAADYFDLDRLAEVGGQRQAYDQSLVDEEANRFAFEQGAPEDAIERYLQLLGSVGGLGSINYTPKGQQPSVNPWLLGAGAATQLAGSAMGSSGFWDIF